MIRALSYLVVAVIGGALGTIVYDAQRARWLIESNCSGGINLVTQRPNPCVPGPNTPAPIDPLALGIWAALGVVLAVGLVVGAQLILRRLSAPSSSPS